MNRKKTQLATEGSHYGYSGPTLIIEQHSKDSCIY